MRTLSMNGGRKKTKLSVHASTTSMQLMKNPIFKDSAMYHMMPQPHIRDPDLHEPAHKCPLRPVSTNVGLFCAIAVSMAKSLLLRVRATSKVRVSSVMDHSSQTRN